MLGLGARITRAQYGTTTSDGNPTRQRWRTSGKDLDTEEGQGEMPGGSALPPGRRAARAHTARQDLGDCVERQRLELGGERAELDDGGGAAGGDGGERSSIGVHAGVV
jgi:hypothetical protein